MLGFPVQPAARSWEGYIATIAQGLLTIEVNTVEKPNMSAQKMPEVPLALHAIVDAYRVYLDGHGVAVNRALVDKAKERLDNLLDERADRQGIADRDAVLVAELQGWRPSGPAMAEMTNGAAAFEALQWAAYAGLGRGADPAEPEKAGVLSRIRSNSRQLREVAIILAEDNTLPGRTLFGSTLEQTLESLFKHPRPQLKVDPDVIVLIRKAWDIGTETVLMQTSVQVDGDVVLRVSPALQDAERRAFFSALHTGCVQTGLAQWGALFGLLRDLAGAVGRSVFRAATG